MLQYVPLVNIIDFCAVIIRETKYFDFIKEDVRANAFFNCVW